jgi:hypothetical protein
MTLTVTAGLKVVVGVVAAALATGVCLWGQAPRGPVDPGPRGSAAGAGAPLPGLTADELAFFQDGLSRFLDIETVTGANNTGRAAPQLKPVLFLPLAARCRRFEPAKNPLIAVATLNGVTNKLPWLITPTDPIRDRHSGLLRLWVGV